MSRRPSGDKHNQLGIRSSFDAHSLRPQYPFAAIVGQEEMKLALLLNVVDPSIGGALIMGHRGTGKSTAVRGLQDLLPSINVVADCVFQCDPNDMRNLCDDCERRIVNGQKLATITQMVRLVDLPLGATEDRVCGTVNLERALKEGATVLEPGLLARANRGFLYVDEVNLLDDHLVDLLLDVAASGVNRVEREGVSIAHPSRFILIGSGNPEEGELRPQLLDRFGLHVAISTESDPQRRAEVVELRNEYDFNPAEFSQRFVQQKKDLTRKITRAQRNLTQTKVDRTLLLKAAQICCELGIEGHRGELTLIRAARGLAAFNGRSKASDEDLRRVAPMALRHRLPRNAFEDSATTERIEQAFQSVGSESASASTVKRKSGASESDRREQQQQPGRDDATPKGNGNSSLDLLTPTVGRPKKIRLSEHTVKNRIPGHKRGIGKKRREISEQTGRHVRSVGIRTVTRKIALAATVRALVASAVSDSSRTSPTAPGSGRLATALRYKLFSRKRGALFVFVIDASGSMARHRIALAKEAILALLRQSYVNRDSVAVVTFRGESATVVLPPSRSGLRARKSIDSVIVGGSTPLAAGLLSALRLLQSHKQPEKWVIVFTDGRANVCLRSDSSPSAEDRDKQIADEVGQIGGLLKRCDAKIVVADTQLYFERTTDSERLAQILSAELLRLNEL